MSTPTVLERQYKTFTQYKRLTAPAVFSLSLNGVETAEYFGKVEEYFKFDQATFIDLADVTRISPDAIMYLLSLMEVYSQQTTLRVQGNRPKEARPRHLLEESGFFSFVASQEPVFRQSTKVLTIRTGERVESVIAEDVINFALRRLQRNRDEYSSGSYINLIECMGNTKQHAYTENLPYKPKWWLGAIYNEAKNCVSFTILDYGQGIPSTVRKSTSEQFSKMFSGVNLSVIDALDSKLVLSALKGELRTRTGLKFRGKGLPKIFGHYRRKLISNLVIISDKAYINLDSNQSLDLDRALTGTVLSWDFTVPVKEENE